MKDAPVAVVGLDGVGKTWAALAWLVEQKEEMPIMLTIPSSTATAVTSISETGFKQLLANCLHEITGRRNSEHWLRRLEFMLKRPVEEGPVLTIFFDGLNQEPSVKWPQLFRILQDETFAGRIRVVATTRTHFFEDRLRELCSLITPAVRVNVGDFDATPGSEFDRMLKFESLGRKDLNSDVIELARNPRLFKLVIRFRKELAEPGQATLHRLLWEYGRDTFGGHEGKSFSEYEWIEWLKEIAHRYTDGTSEFTTKSLGETVNQPVLTVDEVYARLSDIVDSTLATRNQDGSWKLNPALVTHALGFSLLNHLEKVDSPTFDALNVKLAEWLDPISGFDEPAEIMRAAVSVLVGQRRSETSQIAGVLVTALLQSQNVTDNYRQELAGLASNLPSALLDAVEHSDSPNQNSALLWAINALRNIPKTNSDAFITIVERVRLWLSKISRDVDKMTDPESQKLRSRKFLDRIGIDHSGPCTVIEIEFELVDHSKAQIQSAIPPIMEGFPLAAAVPVFEMAAVTFAIRDACESWSGLKWLCLLNETDPDDTATALRRRAELIRNLQSENDVHPDLPKRVAALLLWLTGFEEDDQTATEIDPGIYIPAIYEEDYLPQPGRSVWFPLERRHAELVLQDSELSFRNRVSQIDELLLDPDFKLPDRFVSEVHGLASSIEIEKLHRLAHHVAEVDKFELLEPVLARCAPDLLADLVRRKMRNIADSPSESRYWNATRSNDDLILASAKEVEAARILRCGGSEDDEVNESFVANHLLLLEIQNLEALDQFDTLINAELTAHFSSLAEFLWPLAPADVDELIDRYGAGPIKRQHDLLLLLFLAPTELSDNAWSWVERFAKQDTVDERRLGFRVLASTDPVRFGKYLEAAEWSWSSDKDVEINHHGTHALIKATLDIPFKAIAQRLAPWRLLEAVRVRGAVPHEIELAVDIFGQTLMADGIDESDPGSILSIDTTTTAPWPSTFLATPRPSQDEVENIRRMFDPELQTQESRRAADVAVSRASEVRQSGASLYLMLINSMDFTPVLQHASSEVERWLDGVDGPTVDFKRRVLLAEGTFLALCEALLDHNPELGTQLWRVLWETVTTRYQGVARVDELLHMVFRVPNSLAVDALRKEVAGLKYCNTDQDLFNLAIVASCNNKADWLANLIEEDSKSNCAWRKWRAVTLEGFASDNELPIPEAWPQGQLKSERAFLIRNSARSKWREACAQHWWKAYLDAHDPVNAYATWVLFLKSADRRAWMWMQRDIKTLNRSDNLQKTKFAHALLNKSRLSEAATKRYDKLNRNFLDRNIIGNIYPWSR